MPRSAVFVAAAVAAVVAALPGQSRTHADWYTRAVKSVAASFAPAEAKPGETVTFNLTVELNDGFYSYPLAQTDKAAAGMVNKLVFPAPGTVVFVGAAADPAKVPVKAEPELGIKSLRYCPGTVTFSRKAVVSPRAAAGDAKVTGASLSLSVCEENKSCYPAKTVAVEAALKVLAGPPVAVDPAYADEVAKALAGR